MNTPQEKALEIAAQCWCDPNCSSKTMDAGLALSFAKRYENLLQKIEKLRERCEYLEQHHNGHLPTCGGIDPARNECGCGYLQGSAYRELKKENDKLRSLLDGSLKYVADCPEELVQKIKASM